MAIGVSHREGAVLESGDTGMMTRNKSTYAESVVVLLELIHNRGEPIVLGLVPKRGSL